LGKYGIKSKTVRFGQATPKGYDIGQFKDVFARYLTAPENLPQRRNESPEPMPADGSGVSGVTPQSGNVKPPEETPATRYDPATLEPLPTVGSGGVADDY